MRIRFSIGTKIGLGFSILILLTLSAFMVTQITINKSREINDKINEVYAPSVDKLEQFNLLLVRSKMLIIKWVYFQCGDNATDKQELRTILNKDYPALKRDIKKLSVRWSSDEQDRIQRILETTDKLAEEQSEIMTAVNSFDSYNDPMIMIYRNSVDENEIDQGTKSALSQLFGLIEIQRKNAIKISDDMLSSFDALISFVRWVAIILLVGGVLIAFFTVRSIVKPVGALKSMLISMGQGILPINRLDQRNDEIGEMSEALNTLIDGMQRTTQFANEIREGNFFSSYTPLSENDTLGHALLKMRAELHTNEQILEAKVIERTEEVVRQKEEIAKQNLKLEVLYKHVTDSIRYAKRLQDAILPPDRFIRQVLPNSFVLFKPKDIVSGDFYWVSESDGKVIVAAIDCTGHGVPGAFMSIVGHNILKQSLATLQTISPALILDKINVELSDTLHNGKEDVHTRDGMDVAIITIDFKNKELEYAGAFNPLYLVRDGVLQQFKADKFPVGFFLDEQHKKFTNHKIPLQTGDAIYIFSDGYSDQFGGPKGKKFMVKNFDQLIVRIHSFPVEEQKQLLDRNIEEWKNGIHEQVDDILIIGIKIDAT